MCATQNVKKDPDQNLPIIDIKELISGDVEMCKIIGKQISDACEAHGFFYIKNHGISAENIKQIFAQSKAFFAKDPDFKNRYSIEHSDRFQGYEPPTDQESKEAYVLGPERMPDDPLVQKGVKYHGQNTWPDMPGWKDDVLKMLERMRALAKQLNRGLAIGLGQEQNYFDKLSSDPMCALRLLHYPADSQKTGIEKHTDWGALSLLIQDDTPGLEIERADGSWFVVPPIKDTIVVNIGEIVEIWTNGRFKATPHRVVNQSDHSRYSIAFFLDMDHDAILEPIPDLVKDQVSKYKPIQVSEFIDQMHKRDYGG